NVPAVSYLKAPGYLDGHAGYSSPLAEQTFIVDTLNRLQALPQWRDMVVFITYDDSDGWYDHVVPPIVNHPTTVDDAAICTRGSPSRRNLHWGIPLAQQPAGPLRVRTTSAAPGHLTLRAQEPRRPHRQRPELDLEVHRGQLGPRPHRRRLVRRNRRFPDAHVRLRRTS